MTSASNVTADRPRVTTLAVAATLVAGLAVASIAASALACGSESRSASTASPAVPSSPSTGTPPSATAPVLAASHPGARSPLCATCHALPVAGHAATTAPACVSCHGANGACDPNGRSGVRRHAQADNCVSCHQARHGFSANTECTACHFASKGTRACVAETGPNLPGTLASGCFGWPGAEFSPSNKATVRTYLRAGDRAVEFTLRDTSGAAVTLSGLLATRPVLIVHGAFT
jgi:hypothetical protein